jgi:hypothetical protein
MIDTPNLFEAYAERVKPQHERRRERIAQKRRSTTLIKKMAEKRLLEHDYKALIAKEREELLKGAYAADFEALFDFLTRLNIQGGAALIEHVRTSPWLLRAPPAVRAKVLGLIARRITQIREGAGLPPFDDPLWGARPSLFDEVKAALTQGEAP